MRKRLVRSVPQSPATIVAMIALFLALSGTAVATTSALITGKQIKNNSITGADVKNKSLTPKDFRGSVRGPRGPRGLTGATGATGATGGAGAKGDKGDIGPSAAYHSRFAFSSAGTALPSDAFTTLHTLNLPAGSYTAIATTTVENTGGSNDAGLCELVPSTGTLARYVGSAVPGQFAELSATIAFTLPDAGTVLLKCIGNLVVGTMVRNQSTLTAIKVGEVVQQ